MSIGRFKGASKDNFEIQKCHAVNLKVPYQIMESKSKWQELKPTKKSETIKSKWTNTTSFIYWSRGQMSEYIQDIYIYIQLISDCQIRNTC